MLPHCLDQQGFHSECQVLLLSFFYTSIRTSLQVKYATLLAEAWYCKQFSSPGNSYEKRCYESNYFMNV